ncbi:MAG: hypothetical protein E7368_00830 [Clostridiales bacterium]|nr:hypothetical protein [Clostridiales bacterium]
MDFFIFSDDTPLDIPAENIKWIPFTLKDFNNLAVQKLGIDFTITKPYKLCDFKPMYGVIFEDYLKGYEYWAFGDLDVVYGKITEYLERIKYHKYYKINHAGHFCFIKNIPDATELFKTHTSDSRNYYDILEGTNAAFDEYDLMFKTRALKIPFYDGTFAADIINEKGMQCVNNKLMKQLFKQKNTFPLPKNYHYQLFVTENGRIYRYYRRGFKVKRDEFCYIHYRLELPINVSDTASDTYLFSFQEKGFWDVDVASLQKLRPFMKLVRKYNNRKPLLVEKFDAGINMLKRIFKKKTNE